MCLSTLSESSDVKTPFFLLRCDHHQIITPDKDGRISTTVLITFLLFTNPSKRVEMTVCQEVQIWWLSAAKKNRYVKDWNLSVSESKLPNQMQGQVESGWQAIFQLYLSCDLFLPINKTYGWHGFDWVTQI